jgi:hypothetical protein
MRYVLGIVVGLIVSIVAAIIAGSIAFVATYSVPAGTDANDMRQVIAVMEHLPTATQGALALAWLVSALCGAAAAKLLARRAWAAWAVALVVAVYFGLNALLLPIEMWAKAAWVFGPLLGGLLANRLIGADTAAAVTEIEAPAANP